MKKTIAAFVLGGVITAGAFGISYGLPITSAAEKAAAAKPAEEMAQQCTNTTKSSDSKNIMNSMMADPKATDPKAIEDMTKQCTEMMKNPEMQTMMNTAKTDEKLAGEDSHTAHHQ